MLGRKGSKLGKCQEWMVRVGHCHVVPQGLTPAVVQVLRHADVLHYMGLIDTRQRINALQQQLEVAELITLGASGSHHTQP